MRKSKRKILMDLETIKEVVKLASAGLSTREIARRVSGVTEHMVQYRLGVHKVVTGRTTGLRADWRNGNSPFLDRFLNDVGAIMAKEFERKFVSQVIHVTPKVRPS